MRKGFTLVELVMVVAILAIVSTLAVSKIGSLRDDAARKVSIANQQAVGRAVETWLNGAGRGRLNRLDSLLAYERARGTSSGAGFDFGRTNATARSSAWLYAGIDSARESETERNAGLAPELRAVLAPYGLDAKEASALALRLGLRFVMHHLSDPASVHDGDRNPDGTVFRDVAACCLDPDRSAVYANGVTNDAGAGCYVAAVTPVTAAGRRIYRDCGQELLDGEETGVYDPVAAEREVLATGGVLLAFGLGENASIVGAAQGGLEAVPRAGHVLPKHYSGYILLFRVRKDAAGIPLPEFAGVLDPCGQTIRVARLALK